MKKVFRDLNQQIELLRSRGLIVNDLGYASQELISKNYYNLFNSYRAPFVTSVNSFNQGVRFEEIVTLYNFDQEIRILLLREILKIEEVVKSTTAYYFSELYKDDLEAYKYEKNYNLNQHNKIYFTALQNKISKILDIQTTKEDHIKHYLEKHEYVPFWVLVKSFSMGSLSTFIKLSHQSLQQKLGVKIRVTERELVEYISFLVLFRNEAAHNKRIYSLKYRIKTIPMKTYPNISAFQNIDGNGFFAIMLILKRLLDKKSFNAFFIEFRDKINFLSSNVNGVSFQIIKEEMGLPSNWEDLIDLGL